MTSRSKEIDRIMVRLQEVTDEMVIDLAFAIHSTLVNSPPTGTPIDTGYASAKWWFAVGVLPTRTPDIKGDINGALSQQQATLVTAMNYQVTSGSLFVYNDTKYINRLNHGHSQQSPSFFIENAVDNAVLDIQRKYNRVIEL